LIKDGQIGLSALENKEKIVLKEKEYNFVKCLKENKS